MIFDRCVLYSHGIQQTLRRDAEASTARVVKGEILFVIQRRKNKLLGKLFKPDGIRWLVIMIL
jgi:hypothetical protein